VTNDRNAARCPAKSHSFAAASAQLAGGIGWLPPDADAHGHDSHGKRCTAARQVIFSDLALVIIHLMWQTAAPGTGRTVATLGRGRPGLPTGGVVSLGSVRLVVMASRVGAEVLQ